jgi:type IV pilus assembly protein PilW
MRQISRRQRGLTIIELMVATTLVLIISAAVLTLFINSSRTYNEDERYARMMENGRFALNMLAEDLKMVDFWGEMTTPASIVTDLGADEDCDTDILNPATALLYYYHAAATPMFDPTTAGCEALTGALSAGTDVLALKRVANAADAAPVDDVVYLRTNSVSGELIADADTTPAGVGFSDWQYLARLYYIRDDADGIPYLCRTGVNYTATGATFSAVTSTNDCLAEGIEYLHVEFGIDNDQDGVANEYQVDIDDADAENAVTARVYLLARSALTAPGYTNDKTFALGSVDLGPFNDGYYRRVLSTTVALRNPTSLVILR